MDNIDCLKELTESIVKKQYDSLESIKKLSQATDIISSDISNLINSLQMVGNRQFAENRVQEDEPLAQIGHMAAVSHRSKGASPMTARSLDGDRFNLRAILLDAIKLLPPESKEEAVEQEQDNATAEKRLVEHDEIEAASEEGTSEKTSDILDEINDVADKITVVDELRQSLNDRTHQQDHELITELGSRDSRLEDKPCNKTLNRDRVADILKKYSLYDNDEDDDDDDDDV